LTPRQWRSIRNSLQGAAWAALLLPLVLPGCSALSSPKEDTPAAGPDPTYTALIVKYIKAFKDYETYDSFEISGPRWVHSLKGWSWLTCLRFQDHAHTRVYAFFIKEREVLNSRYAVETDACDAQTYSPFPLLTGKTPPGTSGGLEPIY
jgi:hypothetical protein